jgi:hypothetical protein
MSDILSNPITLGGCIKDKHNNQLSLLNSAEECFSLTKQKYFPSTVNAGTEMG